MCKTKNIWREEFFSVSAERRYFVSRDNEQTKSWPKSSLDFEGWAEGRWSLAFVIGNLDVIPEYHSLVIF